MNGTDMKNAGLLGIVLSVALGVGAVAQTQGSAMTPTSAMSGMNHGAAAPGRATGASMGTGTVSGMSSLDSLTGRAFDRAFLSAMIPHHQAAVDMSREILKTTRDTQVRTWAKAIITSQNTEIREMTALLNIYGGPDRAARQQMQGMMGGMVSAVSQAAPAGRDRAFVRGMLPHHSGAISMGNQALLRSSSPQVLKLAREIVRAQAQEMYAFQLWLLK